MTAPTGALDSCLDASSTGIYAPGGPLDWGTQRARVHVERPAEAVLAELPWRRHELPPHSAVVVAGPSGGRIDRAAVVGGSSSETGLVAFFAGAAGEHFVYWLPYRQALIPPPRAHTSRAYTPLPSRGSPGRCLCPPPLSAPPLPPSGGRTGRS